MKLTLSKRAAQKKSELTQIRHKGNIPAVIYRLKEKGEAVTVDGKEFDTVLRHLKKGYLPTVVFELDLEGKREKAVVKEIQYHPTTYRILHLDFQLLADDTPVDIKVPVACLGEADCVGIKLGGFLRYVKRHIPIRCFPSEIPTDFKVEVQNMKIGDTKRLKDISLGEGIRPFYRKEEVIVMIAKR